MGDSILEWTRCSKRGRRIPIQETRLAMLAAVLIHSFLDHIRSLCNPVTNFHSTVVSCGFYSLLCFAWRSDGYFTCKRDTCRGSE